MKTIKQSYLREHLLRESNELINVLSDETRHLTDVAMFINHKIKNISELNTLLFQEHKDEIKQTKTNICFML